jgi:hypothetical protein
LRVLFFMRHHGYVKNFESTLDLLASRGHEVHLAFDQPAGGPSGGPTLTCTLELARRHPRLTYGEAPNTPPDEWDAFGRRVRFGLDWLRYLVPAMATAAKARERAERRAPAIVRRLAATRAGRTPTGLRALIGGMRAIERATPVRKADLAFVERHRPDLVLVTPMLEGGPQTGYVRAARRLGIRTGLCVSSWDNLTSKGLVHEIPDVVTLWNRYQQREAVELHGVPPERIAATGAQAYDHWFTSTPQTTRAEFCAGCGLDPERPYLLYMCSSGFIGGDEADHIERWIAWLRERPEPELRNVGVLVRPHPTNVKQWRQRDLSGRRQAALWRLDDTEPATPGAKAEFYDSVHHSAAVIGLNSTSLIESAAIGRPVLTLLTPEYAASQEGTMHFDLIAGQEGVLIVGRTWEEHAAQLVAALRDPDLDGDRRRRFVHSFLRPHGMDVEATGVLVAELERTLAAPAPAAGRTSPGTVVMRALLTPLVYRPTRHSAKERARISKRNRRRSRRRRAAVMGGRVLAGRVLQRLLPGRRAAPAPAPAPVEPSPPAAQGERDEREQPASA